MNFGEIKTEVVDTLARNDAVVIGKIPVWVNRRQHQAAARHNFDFLKTTPGPMPLIIGQQQYRIPGASLGTGVNAQGKLFKDDVFFYLLDIATPAGVIEYTGKLLPIKTRDEMLQRFSRNDSGEPEFVTLDSYYGTDIRDTYYDFSVWPPKPDKVYQVTALMYTWPLDLLNDIDTNWFAERFPHMLIAGAVADGFWMLGADEEATVREAQFEKVLREAISTDKGRQVPSDFSLVPSWNSGPSGGTMTRRDWWGF